MSFFRTPEVSPDACDSLVVAVAEELTSDEILELRKRLMDRPVILARSLVEARAGQFRLQESVFAYLRTRDSSGGVANSDSETANPNVLSIEIDVSRAPADESGSSEHASVVDAAVHWLRERDQVNPVLVSVVASKIFSTEEFAPIYAAARPADPFDAVAAVTLVRNSVDADSSGPLYEVTIQPGGDTIAVSAEFRTRFPSAPDGLERILETANEIVGFGVRRVSAVVGGESGT